MFIEDYKDEIKYYEVCFQKDEFFDIFNIRKSKSEKEEFVSLLKTASNLFKKCLEENKIIDGIIIFKNSLTKTNKLQYFNQPIPFNNKELFFFKCRVNIYHDLDTIKFYLKNNQPNLDLIEKKVYVIEKILKNNYIDNKIIYSNEDRMNLLISLIIYPEDKDLTDYNLNLLASEDFEISGNFINDTKFVFKTEKHKNICKNNLILAKKLFLDKKELYNYNYLKKNSSVNISDIKEFLKEIIDMNVFYEAFKILYGEDFENIFKNNEFKNKYFDEFLDFVPYKSLNSSALTDKYTLKTYIFLQTKIINEKEHNIYIKKLLRKALSVGSYIEIEFHEINHFIYSFLFISDNTKSLSFLIPRKEKVPNLREGGLYLELLLFGKILNSLTFKEAMYLLNKNNYKKTLKDFQKGFLRLDDKDLIATGKFAIFNQLINENRNTILNSSIVLKNSKDQLNDIFIEIVNKNCTCIHRSLDFNELKKFIINDD